MIRLRDEVLDQLTVDWVVFTYHWREVFIFEYFTEYFYNHRHCIVSIQNCARTLSNIYKYVYEREQTIPYDTVYIMNRYVYYYVSELLYHDPLVLDKITELYRRHRVAKFLPLMIHRYVPMDIYPTVRSYLQESY